MSDSGGARDLDEDFDDEFEATQDGDYEPDIGSLDDDDDRPVDDEDDDVVFPDDERSVFLEDDDLDD